MSVNQLLEDWMTSNFPDFETIQHMEDESEIRQRDLFNNTTSLYRQLGAILYECNDEEPCMNAACPVCFREYRKQIIYDTLQSIDNINDYCIVTIIFYRDAMTNRDITKANILRIKNKLYQQLNRIGFNNHIIGSIEFDYHCDIEKWIPHFHLLVKKDKNRLYKLNEYMSKPNNLNTRNGVTDKPMKVQDLKDPVKQISYLFKAYAKELVAYRDRNNKRRNRAVRLKGNKHCLYLNIRSELKHSGLLFSYGTNKCKRRY